MAKAITLGKQLLGKKALDNSVVHAHGTGTPQNRTTESHILSKIAHTFDIHHWPVSAIKSYVGHSLATAAGDQLMATLGMWEYGILPGIKSIDKIADDVYSKNLHILTEHLTIDSEKTSLAFLNSKGFGGNNATAIIISPKETEQMLINKHGQKTITEWKNKNNTVQNVSLNYEVQCCKGNTAPIYKFGKNVVEADEVKLSTSELTLKNQKISLKTVHPYEEYLKK